MTIEYLERSEYMAKLKEIEMVARSEGARKMNDWAGAADAIIVGDTTYILKMRPAK
jgi:hypothetical protein